MIDMEKIKARAKEGAHYADWLYVNDLIAEVEKLKEENRILKIELQVQKLLGD